MDVVNNQNRDYVNYLNAMVSEIEAGKLSVFAGAGVSINSGYVDWKGLMKPIIDQLGVSSDIDLALVAQLYENEFGRHYINQLIFNEFNRPCKDNKLIEVLGTLPIKSYWTTNYDSLIEDTLSKNPIGKVIDVKINKDQFKYHVPNHDVVVYKMHGDKKHPDNAVITKNDYETYDTEREVFTKALFTELITNTFLFIGFSFADPNLERILSIVKHTFDNNSPKNHFCFMKSVSETDYDDPSVFLQERNYQKLKIKEMRRYGIQTILVSEFSHILDCLKYMQAKYEQRRVFIAGALSKNIDRKSHEAVFVQKLASRLVGHKYKIVTGFGETIGNYLLIGACEGKSINEAINIHRYIEIYPLVTTIGRDDADDLRTALISGCGSFVGLFGKKEYSDQDGSAKQLEEDGMFQEMRIARENMKALLPVGSTGYTSRSLWQYVDGSDSNIYKSEATLKGYWDSLNTLPITDDALIEAIIKLLDGRNELEQKKLEDRLIKRISERKKVFLSFKYDCSHEDADRIRELINKSKAYLATEKEPIRSSFDRDSILKWIDKKMSDTFATLLIYHPSVFESEFVEYEIRSSQKRKNVLAVLCATEYNADCKEQLKNHYGLTEKDILFYDMSRVTSAEEMERLLQGVSVR